MAFFSVWWKQDQPEVCVWGEGVFSAQYPQENVTQFRYPHQLFKIYPHEKYFNFTNVHISM